MLANKMWQMEYGHGSRGDGHQRCLPRPGAHERYIDFSCDLLHPGQQVRLGTPGICEGWAM